MRFLLLTGMFASFGSAGKKLAAIRLIVESALSCFVRRSSINESLAWSGLDITSYRSTNILVGNLERELGDDRFQAGQVRILLTNSMWI